MKQTNHQNSAWIASWEPIRDILEPASDLGAHSKPSFNLWISRDHRKPGVQKSCGADDAAGRHFEMIFGSFHPCAPTTSSLTGAVEHAVARQATVRSDDYCIENDHICGLLPVLSVATAGVRLQASLSAIARWLSR